MFFQPAATLLLQNVQSVTKTLKNRGRKVLSIVARRVSGELFEDTIEADSVGKPHLSGKGIGGVLLQVAVANQADGLIDTVGVWVARLAPRKRTPVFLEPIEQYRCERVCHFHDLVAQILTDKHHDVTAFISRISQKMDVTANAFGRVAVMARAVFQAGRVDVQPMRIDG